MKKEDLRAKRAAIRKEIKERMQQDLKDRKHEMKRQIKREDLSVEEKREKYRRRAHEEKLRLMDLAKQEFRARKRMLGEVDEESEYADELEEFGEAAAVEGIGDADELEEFGEAAAVEGIGDVDELEEVEKQAPVQNPLPWQQGDDILVDDDADILHPADGADPGGAFILEDSSDERETLRQLESPLGEFDFLPDADGEVSNKPEAEGDFDSEEIDAPNLFYYIYNLIFHPLQTIDEFDDYISFPSGLRNVAIFYLLSIVPVVIFSYIMQSVGGEMGEGPAGSLVASSLTSEPNMLVIYGTEALNLLFYSASIAVVSYLFKSVANFVTLTAYFALVEGVTSVVVYTLVIAVGIAAVILPPLFFLAVPAFLAFVIWRISLSVIVLMGVYGYGVFASIVIIVFALVFRLVVVSTLINGLFASLL